jgi:hypothetical protein
VHTSFSKLATFDRPAPIAHGQSDFWRTFFSEWTQFGPILFMSCLVRGCQIFSWSKHTNIPNDHKQNIFHSKALQNLLKLGVFGLKINHLATLVLSARSFCDSGDFFGRKKIKFMSTRLPWRSSRSRDRQKPKNNNFCFRRTREN